MVDTYSWWITKLEADLPLKQTEASFIYILPRIKKGLTMAHSSG